MTVVLDRRSDLTLENFRRVTVDGEGVAIGEVARRAMEEARAAFVALLEEDRTAFMYGVTSRPGVEVKVEVAPSEQAAWARGLTMLGTGRGFGGGELDERVVRGIVFARLADFVEGNAKARPLVADRIAALLDGPLPKVPLNGQASAGEILPMMHVMSEIFTGDFEEGEWMTLVNGSPCSAALIADAALHARHRLETAELVCRAFHRGIRAPLEAYDPALEELWGDEHEAAALSGLRARLAGAETLGRLVQQAPVSYRIVPRVLGQARRAVAHLEEAARTSLSSAAHNPVFVPPDDEHPNGRLFSTGGYHNAMGYPALNTLTPAWADLALIAERHVTALHTPAVSELPALLAMPGAPGSETNLFGWVAGGFVEGARAAATSTLLPASVNDARDDVSVPTFIAYAKERRGAECLDGALAVLSIVASQALFVAGRLPGPATARLPRRRPLGVPPSSTAPASSSGPRPAASPASSPGRRCPGPSTFAAPRRELEAGAMRVTDVETIVVGTPPPHHGGAFWVFVRATTDSGITGLGEVYGVPFRPPAITALVADIAERSLVGSSPFDIELLWRVVYSRGYTQRPDTSVDGGAERARDGLLGHHRQGDGPARLQPDRRTGPGGTPVLHLHLPGSPIKTRLSTLTPSLLRSGRATT